MPGSATADERRSVASLATRCCVSGLIAAAGCAHLRPVDVADAGDELLVHKNAADGLLAVLDALPQRVSVRILPQRVMPQLRPLRVVVLYGAHL